MATAYQRELDALIEGGLRPGSPALRRAARAALAGARDAHGGATPCPLCGYAGASGLAELELEVNPMGPVLPGMLMEHLGHAAAEAQREDEAEAFAGALVPLVARVVPRAAPVVMRVAPQLIRGVSGVTRTLWRDPATRRLVQAVPTIVTRTAMAMGRRAAHGRPVTPQWAVRTLARQADRVLTDPRERRRVARHTARVDHRYHQAACPRTYAGGAPDPVRERGALRHLLADDVAGAAALHHGPRVRVPARARDDVWTPGWGRE